MKYLIAILLVVTTYNDVDRIARINQLKKEAKEAFNSGNYELAATKYSFLLDSMNVVDDNVRLNLANSYYQLRDTANALNNYGDLVRSDNRLVKSVAHQQLGVMSNREKNQEEALRHFKDALKANPNNEDARYNYELLKKVMKDQQNQDQNKDQNQDQKNDQNKDQDQEQQQEQQNQSQEGGEQSEEKEGEGEESQEQENQDKEGESEEEKNKEGKEQEQQKEEQGEQNKEQKPEEGENQNEEQGDQDKMNSLADKLEEMNISEEKAKMILEAMRNNEIQYLQQNKRKPSKRKDPGKPDW